MEDGCVDLDDGDEVGGGPVALGDDVCATEAVLGVVAAWGEDGGVVDGDGDDLFGGFGVREGSPERCGRNFVALEG